MARIKWLVFCLLILIILFLINTYQQSSRETNSYNLFNIDREDIFNIDISKSDDSISLYFDGQVWSIQGNDTLIVKENSINGFFNNVLKSKRTSLVSKNKNNWDKFNVGDSTGTHLSLKDHNDEELSKITVGSSNAEWSSSNVRVGDEIEVYQTNENIIWQLNVSPTYWGETPKPDTTAADSL